MELCCYIPWLSDYTGFLKDRFKSNNDDDNFFYTSPSERSCNEAALNQIMCRFTITNHMSQAHKSDRCFVYFPG